MADIQKAIVVDGIHTNLINPDTGQSDNYKEVTTWYDGTPMTNAKCDGNLYRKKGAKFLRKVIDKDGELFLEKDTMTALRDLSAYEILLIKSGVVKGLQLNGYYEKGDTPTPVKYYTSLSSELDDGGSVVVVGTLNLKCNFIDEVSVSYFGASPSISDNKIYIENCWTYCKVNNLKMIFESGIYNYSTLFNLGYSNSWIEGKGMTTVLQCTSNTDKALVFDAFSSGASDSPFIQSQTVKNILVSGNANTKSVFYTRGQARCTFENIYVKNADVEEGIGFHLQGTQLSNFKNIGCSTDKMNMDYIPFIGLRLETGQRGSEVVGNVSNCVFDSTYWEGVSIGIQAPHADNNVFLGGSPESCSLYGAAFAGNCRYNSFIGVGFENKDATADISDEGKYNKYINCYFSKRTRIGSESIGISVENCYNEFIEIQSGAKDTIIENCNYNAYNTGTGGFSNAGVNTKIYNVINFLTGVSLPNNIIDNGYALINSLKNKIRNDIQIPVNTIDTDGGMYGLLIQNGDSGYPDGGVAIGIDRTGNYDEGNSIGSFRIFSPNDISGRLQLIVKKSNSPTGWITNNFILDSDTATTSQKGVVNQAVASPDVAAVVGATYTQAEVQAILDELRDLKTKLRASGILST